MVYGAGWCEKCTEVRRLLTKWGIKYHYIDIEADAYAKQKVARWSFGELVTPVVACGALENPRLVDPTEGQLHVMLYQVCTADRLGPLLL
jgi:glutaredoxin